LRCGNELYQLILLDFDGTLAATLDDVAWCMTKTFEAFGLQPPSRKSVLATMGLPLEDVLRALSEGKSVREEECWVRLYREIYKTDGALHTSLFPGVAETLALAHQHGIATVVLSNKGTSAIQASLERLGVISHVDLVFGGDLTEYRKPDPRLYTTNLKRILPAINDSEVLMVGDTETDLEFAMNACVDSCWASYGYGNRQRCLQLAPTHIVESLYELAPLLNITCKHNRTAKGTRRCNLSADL